ncbi:glycine--tRNA ligase subunit beta [Carnobacterium sp. TMP28]|uniref:glycine--tRNA ligase subunit beta n=1 Tax=Carnobacterium sp. TMP28 TaxID=3397060 RepID=UPI0039E084C8
MTKNLLLEIGLEEIPAHIVAPSRLQLVERMKQFLDENRLSYGEILPFSTPRRLAVIIKDLSEKQVDIEESAKGPAKKIALDAQGNWSKAAMGFVRGQKLMVEDIYFKEINGIEYVHVDKFIEGLPTKTILTDLDKVITSMTFPVSMNWANHHFNYIRPIHWITAMLDDEIIPFTVLDIETSNTSRGHRFLGKDVTFETALDYEQVLEKVFVIADSDKRQHMIVSQVDAIAKEHDWAVSIVPNLLEEINNLVEYPTAFYGKYNPAYLEIPEEILITSMRDHQRYVDVADHTGNLLPYFISVRNGNAEFIDNVVRGNEKVLTARLEDALFFYKEDKKLSIDTCVEQLKQVTFHEKIGSVYEKMQRVRSFARTIGKTVGLTNEEQVSLDRAAEIYKFDLVTNVVGEFPELQGVMGEKYALLQGETPAVATAIREHYLPISSDGDLPKSSIGAVLALADKLESMMSFFAIGKVPTGSNDPFALRRQAYGLVRIVTNENWFFPMNTLRKDILNTLSSDSNSLLSGYEKSSSELVGFIKARLQQFMRNEKIRYDIIEATLNSDQENLVDMLKAGRELEKQIAEQSFKPTIESLTRVLNLTKKNKEKIDLVNQKVDKTLFETDSEINLANQIEKINAVFGTLETEEKFKELKSLQPHIDAFFGENMVMTDNEAVRNNRLSLLSQIALLTLSFASIDKLVVK